MSEHYIGYPNFGDPAFDRIFEYPEDKLKHMVTTWNERVKEEDTVLVLGGFIDYESPGASDRLKWLVEVLHGRIVAHVWPEEYDFIKLALVNFAGDFDIKLEKIKSNDETNVTIRSDKYNIQITGNNIPYSESRDTDVISVNINSDINDGFGPLSFDNLIAIQESFENE